ncbi:MAG: hypothetical protein V1773_10600 [bacterium]
MKSNFGEVPCEFATANPSGHTLYSSSLLFVGVVFWLQPFIYSVNVNIVLNYDLCDLDD